MEREATEERVGAIAEWRGDAGVAKERHAHRHERHQRSEAFRRGDVARHAAQRLVESGSVGIDFGRNERPADARLGARRNEFRRIEAGLGDDRRVARGDARRRAVDGRESLHLTAIHALERTVDEGQARGGVGIVGGRGRVRGRLHGERAQGFALLIDRMRFEGGGRDAGAGEGGVGARLTGVRGGWGRGPESPDRAQRIGWGRRRWSVLTHGGMAPPFRTRRRARRRPRRASPAAPVGRRVR